MRCAILEKMSIHAILASAGDGACQIRFLNGQILRTVRGLLISALLYSAATAGGETGRK